MASKLSIQNTNPSEDFNEKNISNMTYQEILDRNRESRKSTFMDRTWRETSENVLENKGMSRWDKFTSGGYTFRNLG